MELNDVSEKLRKSKVEARKLKMDQMSAIEKAEKADEARREAEQAMQTLQSAERRLTEELRVVRADAQTSAAQRESLHKSALEELRSTPSKAAEPKGSAARVRRGRSFSLRGKGKATEGAGKGNRESCR